MSLQLRLADLITAIGADIKALQAAAGGTPDRYNASTINQTISGNTDTYIAGSGCIVPQGKVKVGTTYKCKFNVVKTAAATAAPVVTVRLGNTGTTADASRAALTFAAQTAVIDEGQFEIEVVFQTAGASATCQALGSLIHRLGFGTTPTGLSTSGASVVINKGASFDVTGSGLQIGLSLNAGPSSSWVLSLVSSELKNLT